jgi:hypothetical protein
MKTLPFLAFSVAAMLPMSIGAEPFDPSGNTQLEPVESLTTREIWNTTQPVVTQVGAVVVDTRMFDSEARPSKGKLRGCGVVLIGTGDTGIQPVGIRIWTLPPCSLDLSVQQVASARSAAEFTIHINARQSVRVRVSNDLKVFVDGAEFGRISD